MKTEIPELTTPRLKLRFWKDSDSVPFAAMNADPRVMEFMPKPLSREESDAFIKRIQDRFLNHGFGLWALELHTMGEFIGYVGLSFPSFESHFTPCVEIGWRLAYNQWGQGLATEAAQAVLNFAFGKLGLPEVVSFTVPANTRSRRIMEKLGMTHDSKDDFDHPLMPINSPGRRHVLYRLQKEDWPFLAIEKV